MVAARRRQLQRSLGLERLGDPEPPHVDNGQACSSLTVTGSSSSAKAPGHAAGGAEEDERCGHALRYSARPVGGKLARRQPSQLRP
jgi:hypothetical protein